MIDKGLLGHTTPDILEAPAPEQDTPAVVATLRAPSVAEEHPWHCGCPDCAPEPSYVRTFGGAS